MSENVETPAVTEENVAAATERLRNQARGAAEKRLREANNEQWREFMFEEHEARGVTWNARLTPAEKARREIKRLAAEHHVDLVTLAEQAAVEDAFEAADTTTVESEAEARRAEAAESIFGGQAPLQG